MLSCEHVCMCAVLSLCQETVSSDLWSKLRHQAAGESSASPINTSGLVNIVHCRVQCSEWTTGVQTSAVQTNAMQCSAMQCSAV